MSKRFWGYNSKAEAITDWSEEVLSQGVKTTKTIPVVDNPSVCKQTSTQTVTVTRIELKSDIISY